MDTSIKKTSYELLSMTDSESELQQQIYELNHRLPRRKRLRKRLPVGRSKKYNQINNKECHHSYGRVMSLSFIIIILCCWLLILSWLIILFNDELRRFDGSIRAMAAGNQGIPESLQKCHSQNEQIQRNQSILMSRMADMESRIENISSDVQSMSNELSRMQNSVKSFSVSKIDKLSDQVLYIHNLIGELNETVVQLDASGNHLQKSLQVVQTNFTSLKETLSLLEKVPIKSSNISVSNPDQFVELNKVVMNLTDQLAHFNNSLSRDIENLRKNIFNNPVVLQDLKDLLKNNVSMRLGKVENDLSKMDNLMKGLNNKFVNTTVAKSKFVTRERKDSKNTREEPSVPMSEQ